MVPHMTKFMLRAAVLIPTPVFPANLTGPAVAVLDDAILEALDNYTSNASDLGD
jgi:hypothetical protein